MKAQKSKRWYQRNTGTALKPTFIILSLGACMLALSCSQPKPPSLVAVLGDSRSAPIPATDGSGQTAYDESISAATSIFNAIAAETPELIVHTGDIANDGTDARYWTIFDQVSAAKGEIPFYPAAGNHEREADLFYDHFQLPGNERWYSIDAGSARFFILNTNIPTSPSNPHISEADWAEELSWLEAALSAADADTAIRHEILVFHHPLYTVSAHPGNEIGDQARAALLDMIARHGVRLVLNGHNHCYERSDVNGVQHVIAGGGGSPLYDPVRDPAGEPYPVVYAKAYSYCLLTISRAEIILEAKTAQGTELDTVSIPSFRD
jgi:3',5'-cyclic AMP phosphodiesterase CpdA